jgi:N-acylglucosamine 2-epimerase/mannose-6-phosphate isomerase
MHLMEAMNAWVEASGEPRFAVLADELAALLVTKFSDGQGALGEFFNADLTPCNGPRGEIVEPGHQFEWAWIIAHHGRLTGQDQRAIMRRLIASGFRHGFDEATGLTVDQVDRRGKIIAASHRLWPQTEALKAALAAHEFLGEGHLERIGQIVEAIFTYFLRPGPVGGTWIDHFDADWRPIVEKVPASSLYHLSLAFFELLRLRDRLESPADGPAI